MLNNPDINEESEMDNDHSKTEDNLKKMTVKSSRSFIKKYPVLVTILIAIVAILIVYYWKDAKAKKEKAAVVAMASEQLVQNNRHMLKLLCKPLVWSIRSEMLRGNLEQVDIYTSDLVKEKNFQFIYIVDPQGQILISTNKKLQGRPASGILADSLLLKDSVTVVNGEDENLIVSAPVMGFDKRLATIIFKYYSPGFIFDDKAKALNNESIKN